VASSAASTAAELEAFKTKLEEIRELNRRLAAEQDPNKVLDLARRLKATAAAL
jgi:hypothetical protein